VSENRGTPPGAGELFAAFRGLRYATTTGYFLTAFQAEIRLPPFHITSVSAGMYVEGKTHPLSRRTEQELRLLEPAS